VMKIVGGTEIDDTKASRQEGLLAGREN
jgi:hypothetical protein